MPLPILDVASDEVLKTFKQLGGCFVPIPKHIQANLEHVKATSDDFFALPKSIKKEELKLPEDQQGYVDQSTLGYAIERYVFHGLMPKNVIMRDILVIMNEARDYLQQTVLQRCLHAIMHDLGIPETDYLSHIKSANNTLSIIHYPGQDVQPDRLPAHADGALLTVLWAPQPGLEALIEGVWQSVETPPGYVIVQIGDGLMEWTNGQVAPLMHRVIVEANKPRTSIASFATLKPDTPFHNLITDAVISDTFHQYIMDHLKGTYKPR